MKNSMYQQNAAWYKGNLHCHSSNSDGCSTPQERADEYRNAGYSFLAITDHNRFDSYTSLNRDDFIIIPGVEKDISVPGRHKFWHFVGVTDHQIDEQICELECHTGLADAYLDMMLRAGKRVYCFASDDSHWENGLDRFGGYIMVKAKKLTQESILEAIASGSFYSSTGPEIYDFGIENDRVYLHCSDCKAIHFVAYEEFGKSFIAHGEPLNYGERKISGQETFIRAECVDDQGKKAWTNPLYIKK